MEDFSSVDLLFSSAFLAELAELDELVEVLEMVEEVTFLFLPGRTIVLYKTATGNN